MPPASIQSINTDQFGVLTIITDQNARMELSPEASVILFRHLLKSLEIKAEPRKPPVTSG